jgi:transposase-like protein
MPGPYPPEFPQRAIGLVRDGLQVKQTAVDLGIYEVTLDSWLRQDDINHKRQPGNTSGESAELSASRQRIRQLEKELATVKRAQAWLAEEERVDPAESRR